MFYDYHTHTEFSDDSDAAVKGMLDSAIAKGITEICVTDHFDPGYPDRDFPFELDFDRYMETLAAFRKEYEGRLTIKRGVEVGIQHNQIDRCQKAVSEHDFDYVIGSFHCALGEPLYEGHFYDNKTPKEAFTDYFTYMYENILKFSDFNNMGHLNIVARYADEYADFKDYGDIVESILKFLIENGKGIELNTSSFRYKTPKEAFTDYFTYMYENILKFSDFNNMGHLNIVARYADEYADFKDYGDIVESILKFLIENGKGIELNTSSFRYKMKETCPSREILTMYHDLGGEILTIGSDAHRPEDLAHNFESSLEYLKSLGFKYVCSFTKRKPEFHPI